MLQSCPKGIEDDFNEHLPNIHLIIHFVVFEVTDE